MTSPAIAPDGLEPLLAAVGVRERVGRHHAQANRWRDVVFIERRSPAIT